MNDVVKKIPRTRKIAIIAGGVILVGTLAAYAGIKSAWNGDHMKYAIDHVSEDLKLDDNQRAQLESLATQMIESKRAMHSGGAEISSILASIEGSSLDQTALNTLITNKLDTARQQAPKLITLLASFYDGLDVDQQALAREKLGNMAGRWGSHRPKHGHQ